MNTRRVKKQSYSSREVSRITALQSYVLHYWETEFEALRPKKDRHGNRSYRLDDIKLIFQIKKLLYEEKYTIAGARQRLSVLAQSGRQMDLSFERLRKEDAVFEIKKCLQEILALLDHTDQRESAGGKITVVEPPSKKKAARRVRRASAARATTKSASNGMHLATDTIVN